MKIPIFLLPIVLAGCTSAQLCRRACEPNAMRRWDSSGVCECQSDSPIVATIEKPR